MPYELWCCGELGSLQNVRVKTLRSAFVSDVISWMEQSHLGFKLENIMDVFMVCACASVSVNFVCLSKSNVLVDVSLPRIYCFY